MNNKAVVLGAGGQLGAELVRVFRADGYEVSGYTRADLDIADREAVEAALTQAAPTVVLNAAAYNLVDKAEIEPQAAYLANALAVQHLAVACRRVGARLVHYSTDYVFDGSLGRPYAEEDATHPIGAYGVSKLAGELYAQAYLENALILRVCGVFGVGGLQTARGNFVETMLRLAQSGKPLRIVASHTVSPTYVPAIAERTLELVVKQQGGMLHLGGGEPVTWHGWAQMIFAAAGVSPEVHPVDESEYPTAAKRPRFSALSNSKVEALGITPMPPLQRAIEDYMRQRSEAVEN